MEGRGEERRGGEREEAGEGRGRKREFKEQMRIRQDRDLTNNLKMPPIFLAGPRQPVIRKFVNFGAG